LAIQKPNKAGNWRLAAFSIGVFKDKTQPNAEFFGGRIF
jgi:hypothetical protein